MTALEKILKLTGPGPQSPAEEDLNADLVLALSTALAEIRVCLAKTDPDSDGDDDSTAKGDTDHDYWTKGGKQKKSLPGKSGDGKSSGKDDDGDGENDEFAAMVARLVKKGVPEARAKMMAKQAMNRVKASALAGSACVILAGLTEPEAAAAPPTYLGRVVALAAPPGESASDRRSLAAKGWALPDGSYPIPDKKHLHSAAVLAASGHGNASAAKRLIRKRAKDLGVDVSSLPGFGGEKAEKVAATMVALAAGQMREVAATAHAPFHGVHSHPHVHSGDNVHGPAADRMPMRPGY